MTPTVTPPTLMPSVIAAASNFAIDVTVALPAPADTVVSAGPPAARPAGAPTNDSIVPSFLIWGFVLVTSPWLRGFFAALSGWTKFATLVVAPLWLTYPGPVRRPRPLVAFASGFALATVLALSVLFLDGHPIQAAHTFFDRTIKTQITRDSPFSLWDWAQYHARGLPDLHVVQWVLEGLLVLAAIAVAFVPSRKTPLQLAALTGALLIGFELVLTHWFYLYIAWFFPFVAFALLSNGRRERDALV